MRSSSTDEDGADFSFAGQFESYLYVTKNRLEERIKQVWISSFSERVFQYRQNNGLPPVFGLAVLIQQMINSEVAGVAFGINPANGDRNAKVISAVYGLGEGLVSGDLDSDNFIVKEDEIIDQIAAKEHCFVLNEGPEGGTKKEEVEENKRHLSTLTKSQILEIAAVLDKASAEFGKPQDMEFAVNTGQVFWLQSRPVTNLHKITDPSGDYILWDNSNIGTSQGVIASTYWTGDDGKMLVADDFEANALWTIYKIHSKAGGQCGASIRATKYGISIYTDNNNKPGTEIFTDKELLDPDYTDAAR